MAARTFAVSCLLYAVAVAILALTLPDTVPLHFGAGGEVDRTGSRAEFLVVAGVVGVLLAGVLGGFARWSRRLPLELVNVPHARYWKTPEHEPELRNRLSTDLYAFGAATMLFLTAMFLLVGQAAAAGTGLSGWAVVLLVAFLAGAVGWAIWLATARYRPPATGQQ
ncbi:DUF1648 domain-containing protein [Modestobacter sp. SYSU DS0511]